MRDRLIELKTQFVENFNCGNCKPEENKCKKCLTEKETDYLLENDIVNVVRCKDCKYYKPYNKPVEDFDGECIVREFETDETEFCSYAKLKENNDETKLY